MKKDFISDGNYIGRLGALLLIGAIAWGYHEIECASGMCPMMKTDSCCGSVPAAAPAAK